ncbi:MAG: DUF3782 domain-containing protein [Candidatus Nezhaarchaeota archaeon]|nr:DUF3782 domain-containing protein [Candidatus Nezhaarchaeota archaeon]
MGLSELKAKVFELLREDLEFRYAVAGLLGLEEVLRRLDRHEAELAKLREDFNRKAEEDSKKFASIEAELAKLREDMMLGFKRHDEELAKLREDVAKGFNLIRRHIDALGARWGMLSERAFREGLKGLIEKELGLQVEKWVRRDEEGYVHGHPSVVDLDVAVSDRKLVLIEVKSHVDLPDVSTFKRKAEFYERVEKRRPDRLVIVTPYADEEALEAARQLQVEIYTGV